MESGLENAILNIWGRNGFDGDFKDQTAGRDSGNSLNAAILKINAEDNLALAA